MGSDAAIVGELPLLNNMITNITCETLIFFGLIGTTAFLALICLLIKHLGNKQYLFVIPCMLLLCNSQGSVVGLRIWVHMMILLVTARIRSR